MGVRYADDDGSAAFSILDVSASYLRII